MSSSPGLALLVSALVLGAGALLAAVLDPRPRVRSFLDGFVLVTVAALCLLFLFPEALETLGVVALPFGALGLALPWASERLLAHRREGTSRAILLAALVGLLLHNAIDGAALASAGEHAEEAAHAAELHTHGGEALTLAVVAHQLPVGLLLGGALMPLFGRRGTALAVLALIAATGLGFLLGHPLLTLLGASSAAALEALLAGGLLHVVVDHAPEQVPTPAGARAAGAGALLAGALLWLLPLEPGDEVRQAATIALGLAERACLPLLAGLLLAGLLALAPAARVKAALARAPGPSVRGALLGPALPICGCGPVPLQRELLREGVPPAAAAGFLLAAPALAAEAVLVTLPLLGVELALLRALAALLLAALAGWAAGRLAGSATVALATDGPGPGRAGGPLRRVLRHALIEGLDDLGPWCVAGVVVAALAAPVLAPLGVATLPPPVQVGAALLLAAGLQVHAAAAAPLAAVLLAGGVAPGAALALLLAAPALNRTVWGALRSAHGSAAAWAGSAAALAVILAVAPLAGHVPALGLSLALPPALGQAAALAFGLLLAASLFRQGPRGFLARLGIGHAHRHGGPHEHDLAHERACQEAECEDAPAAVVHHDHAHGHEHEH